MGLFKRKALSDSVAVSVLTPVYNVEPYLRECLDSLESQTLREMEFICINDGSTDDSLAILKEYARRDSRFVIIDKPNSGYGASMNCGLDIARGEYVGIVESDDWADRSMFRKLYDYARKNDCDVVKSNYYEYDGRQSTKVDVWSPFRTKRVFDVRQDLEVVKMAPLIWAGLYRRGMLEDAGIRFNETPGASFQDTSFVLRSWFASRRIALLTDAYLHYRVSRAESSVKSSSKVFEVCGEYELVQGFLEQDPQRMADFGAILNVCRLGTYRWNYSRVAREHQLEFARRWSEELRREDEAGRIMRDLYDPQEWQITCEVRDDPDGFFTRHTEV